MGKIVIIGAGSAGTMAANRLHRKLRGEEAEITVIDKSDTHYFQPSYYLLPFDYETPEAQSRPIEELLNSSIEFHQDAVTGVDPEEQVVKSAGDDIDYDYLIVATGHELRDDMVTGLAEAAEETNEVFPFYQYDQAVAMSDALDDFDGGTFLVTRPATPIKCPGAPSKMTMLMDDYLSRQGLRDDSRVIMTSPGGSRIEVISCNEWMEGIWEDRDIEFVPNFAVEQVDYENNVVRSANGNEIEYDLYAPVSPQWGAEPIVEGSPLTEGGQPVRFENVEGVYTLEEPMPTEPYVTVDWFTLQHEEYENIFAIGDCNSTPAPPTAAAARKQAPVAVKNLLAHMRGDPMEGQYNGYTACPLHTGKGKSALTELTYEGPLSDAHVASGMTWKLSIDILPKMYWNMWMKGFDPVPV
jgi:sulfide:quinone oxidoreductase